MRSTLFTAVSLFALASAQPAHRHRALHQKKDVVTVVNTVIAAAPSEQPLVVIYVNEDNVPVSTTTKNLASALYTNTGFVSSSSTSASSVVVANTAVANTAVAPVATTSIIPAVTAPVPISTLVTPVVSASSPPPAKTPSAAPSASPAPSVGAAGFGSTYGPYHADGTCKNAAEVMKDINAMPADVGYIRTYGVDCKTVENVYPACKAKGLKHLIGVFNPQNNMAADLVTIKSAVNGDWSSVYAISIGNELVNMGAVDASSVVAMVIKARTTLRGWGVQVPVVTTDTLVATRSHPQLCDNSDFCAVNAHPFFDSHVAAKDSGSFLTTQIATLRAKLNNANQRIVITETGWPHQGLHNGLAVPSPQEQQSALSSIKSAFAGNPSDVCVMSHYDDLWKVSNAQQFEAEKYWGVAGTPPSG